MQREPVEGGQNGSSIDVIIYSTNTYLSGDAPLGKS